MALGELAPEQVRAKVVELYVEERATLHPKDYWDTEKMSLDYWHMLAMLKHYGQDDIQLVTLLSMRTEVVEMLNRRHVAEQIAKRLIVE